MAEYNIFEIIRSEKKKLLSVSPNQVSKVFAKYYSKYMIDLHHKFNLLEENIENVNISFLENQTSIGNFLFHIFYAIYLTSFNIHISIFFLERASILFYEFISLSLQEKEYKIESNSHINDAIIFTYKKTMGNATLENIMEENKNNKQLQSNNLYHKILAIRNSSYLLIKIINKIMLEDNYKKIYRAINDSILKIYSSIDIDSFLYSQVSLIVENYEKDVRLILIRILLDVIVEFINLDFFQFNNEEKDIVNFTNYLDLFFHKFIQNTNLDMLAIDSDLKKNKLFLNFKENILRYISN